MREMFSFTSSFNQSLNKWNVSNVRRMDDMFLEATSFNQPLNNWNVTATFAPKFDALPTDAVRVVVAFCFHAGYY